MLSIAIQYGSMLSLLVCLVLICGCTTETGVHLVLDAPRSVPVEFAVKRQTPMGVLFLRKSADAEQMIEVDGCFVGSVKAECYLIVTKPGVGQKNGLMHFLDGCTIAGGNGTYRLMARNGKIVL